MSPHDIIGIANTLHSKVQRSKKHILELEERWSAFASDGGYRIAREDDSQTGDRTYRLADVKPIPVDIPLIVGDAIQNLRSALDHVAHFLVSVGLGPGHPPITHAYFPIAENATKYNAELPRKVRGMRQAAINAINAIQPYGGGNGELLWVIHTLNNIDKHRLLLTAMADMPAHSISPSDFAKQGMPEWIPPNQRWVILKGASGTHFPLNAGDVLLTVPKADVQEKMQFSIVPAFSEPQIVKGKSVMSMLWEMNAMVRRIIFNFADEGLYV